MISAMVANDEIARARLADAQARQKAAADEYRRQATYVVNDQVMLATENLTAYQHKLCCRYLGPFAVLAVGNGTVTLDLPTELRRSYPTVNVDRVKPCTPSVGEWPGRQQHNRPLPGNAGADGAPQWEVEAVLGKKEEKEWRKDQAGNEIKKGGKVSVVRYLIAWLGYPASEWTWVRKDHLDGANDLIVDYERKSSPRPGRHQVMFCSTSSADE